jgi:hypothetical protein
MRDLREEPREAQKVPEPQEAQAGDGNRKVEIAPIDGEERQTICAPSGSVFSIFSLNDLAGFGTVVSHLGTATDPALILAVPWSYQKYSDEVAVPRWDGRYTDVAKASQRFILCYFSDAVSAAARFKEGWSPVGHGVDKASCEASALLGNSTRVNVLVEVRIGHEREWLPLGTTLGELCEPFRARNLYGAPLTYVRGFLITPAPKSRNHLATWPPRRLVFYDLPSRGCLNHAIVAPLDSLGVPPL